MMREYENRVGKVILFQIDYEVAKHLIDIILTNLIGINEEEDPDSLLSIRTQELQPQLYKHLQELYDLIDNAE